MRQSLVQDSSQEKYRGKLGQGGLSVFNVDYHWELFLLKTRVIFLTFFSLLYHFLIVNKEMQQCSQFAMVKSQ